MKKKEKDRRNKLKCIQLSSSILYLHSIRGKSFILCAVQCGNRKNIKENKLKKMKYQKSWYTPNNTVICKLNGSNSKKKF